MTTHAAPNGHSRFRDGDEVGGLSCVTVRRGIGHDVVALAGEFDAFTAQKLTPVIQDLLAEGRTRITVNLDDVTFMDGYTIGVLVAAHRDVKRAGGSLDITHNPLCARLLVITGTTTFLHL